MLRNIVIIALFILLWVVFASVAPAAKQGPATIDIYGGESGKVHFPHADHQKRIDDCNVCHSVFPQEKDAIKKMKEKGAIKAKKVMNLQCIKCHKAEKRAGKPSGPTTCKTCHVK